MKNIYKEALESSLDKDINEALESSLNADEMSDVVNTDLQRAIDAIKSIMEHQAEHIRPWEAAQVSALAFEYAALSVQANGPEMMQTEVAKVYASYCENTYTDILPGQGFTSEFVEGLPDVVKADILLQMPIVDCVGHSDPGAAVERHFALDVAKHLGPEWAQAWYHFTVFMTKVA